MPVAEKDIVEVLEAPIPQINDLKFLVRGPSASTVQWHSQRSLPVDWRSLRKQRNKTHSFGLQLSHGHASRKCKAAHALIRNSDGFSGDAHAHYWSLTGFGDILAEARRRVLCWC